MIKSHGSGICTRMKLPSIEALGGHPSLRHLTLHRVTGLSDLSPAGQIPLLESLSLEGVSAMTQFPDLRGLQHLRSVFIEKAHALRDLSAVAGLRLESFAIFESRIPEEVLEPIDVLKAEHITVYLDRGGRIHETKYTNTGPLQT